MYDYRNVLSDESTSEQAWSEHFEALFVDQLNTEKPSFGDMIVLYDSLAGDRKDWLIDSILDSDLDYTSQFVEKTFDDSKARSQVIYSYRDRLKLDINFLNKIIDILKLDAESPISRSLLSSGIKAAID